MFRKHRRGDVSCSYLLDCVIVFPGSHRYIRISLRPADELSIVQFDVNVKIFFIKCAKNYKNVL